MRQRDLAADDRVEQHGEIALPADEPDRAAA